VESAKIDSIVDQVADSASDVIKKVAQSAQDSLSKSVQPAQRYNIDRTRELFQGSVSESSGETTEGETVVEESPENIRDKVEITVSHRKKSEKPVNVEQKIAMAYKAMVSGQTEAAINVYKQVLEVQHRNKTALFGLATAYHRNNQLQQARSIYLEILQLYPKHQEAMNNFMLLVAKEDPNKALNELKKIERVNPNYSPVLAQIGMVYLQMENLKQAKSYLARAVGLTPGNASYLYNYAVILDSSGEEKQAVIFYQRLLKEVDRGAVIAGSVEKVVRRLEFLKRKLNHGS
jgi:tetratricopeptide (TPR) repeat protein